MTIFLFISNWVIIFLLLFILVFLFLWMASLINTKAPFVPVSYKTLKQIDPALNITDDSVVYDLGSGDGRVLFHLSKIHPNTKFVGIDFKFFPILLSRVWLFFHKNKNITIIHNDFFKEDISRATHIFTYLYPNVMDDLLPKLEKELKPGTKLISVHFRFTLKQPSKEFILVKFKNGVEFKLFVYEF